LLGAQNPNWEAPDGSIYDFNASIVSTIAFDGSISDDSDDRVALFVGEELRGLSVPVEIGSGVYRHFITVYSNEASESMDIKVYHADTDEVYQTAAPFDFQPQGIDGSVDNPFRLNIYPNNDAPIYFLPIDEQVTLEGLVFDSLDLIEYLVQVDDQEVEWTYTANSNLVVEFTGSILTVMPVEGFSGSTTLVVRATELPISSSQNEQGKFSNSTALFAEVSIQFDVTPVYAGPAWYQVPGQGTVLGGEFESIPLHDYEYQYAGSEILYDYLPVFEENMSPDTIPDWIVEEDLATNMTITAQVNYTPKYQFLHKDDVIAAVIDGEVRGVAQRNSTNDLYYLSITGAADENSQITILFYSGELQKVFTLTGEYMYVPHDIIGSAADPSYIEVAPIVPVFPEGPVSNGIATVPVIIVDAEYIGTEYFRFYAFDPLYPDYLKADTLTSFCVLEQFSDLMVWYEDNDGDGLGDPSKFIFSCEELVGYVDNGDDCDDTTAFDPTVSITMLESSGWLWVPGDSIVCKNDNVQLLTSGGIAYEWSDGQTGETIYVSPEYSQNYSVTVTFSYGCKGANSIDLMVEGKVVTDSINDGLGTLRSVLACISDGDTITYDQPDVWSSYITSTLDIDKSVSISGMDSINRPEIIFDFNVATSGLDIDLSKILTLDNVDLKLINPAQKAIIEGEGTLSISGQTKITEEE